jgi:hypothetical protein
MVKPAVFDMIQVWRSKRCAKNGLKGTVFWKIFKIAGKKTFRRRVFAAEVVCIDTDTHVHDDGI